MTDNNKNKAKETSPIAEKVALNHASVNEFDELRSILIRMNPSMIQHVSTQSDSLMIAAVETDGLSLQYCKRQTYDLCMTAVSQNGFALQFVDDNFHNSKICLAAIENSEGWAIQFCKRDLLDLSVYNQLCRLAIKLDPNNLEYINDPSDSMILTYAKCRHGEPSMVSKERLTDVALELVRIDPGLASYVNQTERLCLEMFNINHMTYRYFDKSIFENEMFMIKLMEMLPDSFDERGHTHSIIPFIQETVGYHTEKFCLRALRKDMNAALCIDDNMFTEDVVNYIVHNATNKEWREFRRHRLEVQMSVWAKMSWKSRWLCRLRNLGFLRVKK